MIYVAGDSILDEYWHGNCSKLSPEFPVPIISFPEKTYGAGGAANVANNLVALGEDVILYTTIGDDWNGRQLYKLINCTTIFESHHGSTVNKIRIYANNHNVCRVDEDFKQPAIVSLPPDANFVILSDYHKGTLDNAAQLIRSSNARVVVDPKRDFIHYEGAWLVKPNLKELHQFCGQSDVIEVCKYTLQKYNIHSMLVTMGKDGMQYVDRDITLHVPAETVDVIDVTGAGDVVIAALTHALNKGDTMLDAMQFATKCAAKAVAHHGTYIVVPEKVIFTNGCFDILHKGHIDLLQKSKELGDKLIVGLNSDESIKKLKGPTRPIHNQQARKQALLELKSVDEVIIFDEETPYELIKRIKPSIITKGGDYKAEDVVGNNLCEVIIIPTTNGYSTTKIIESIKNET